jgi:hypothetical protein
MPPGKWIAEVIHKGRVRQVLDIELREHLGVPALKHGHSRRETEDLPWSDR